MKALGRDLKVRNSADSVSCKRLGSGACAASANGAAVDLWQPRQIMREQASQRYIHCLYAKSALHCWHADAASLRLACLPCIPPPHSLQGCWADLRASSGTPWLSCSIPSAATAPNGVARGPCHPVWTDAPSPWVDGPAGPGTSSSPRANSFDACRPDGKFVSTKTAGSTTTGSAAATATAAATASVVDSAVSPFIAQMQLSQMQCPHCLQ